jgi:hypothetical protein
MSGNAVMNERTTSVISVGSPPLIAIVPPSVKWSATLAGSSLHHASVYVRAKSRYLALIE